MVVFVDMIGDMPNNEKFETIGHYTETNQLFALQINWLVSVWWELYWLMS